MANTLIGRLTPTNNMGGTLTNESRLTGQLGGVGAAVTYASLPDKPSINNVELVGNKTTNDLNISYNDLRDQPVIPDVGEIDERLDNLEGNITSLGGRVTTAEGNITDLQGDTSALDTRLTTAEGNITSLGGRITTAEGNITSLDGRVTTNEGNITDLQGDTSALDTRLTTAEGNITSLGGRITTAEGNITSLDGRVTTNEGDILDLQGDMSQAQSDITQLNSSLSTKLNANLVQFFSAPTSGTNLNTLISPGIAVYQIGNITQYTNAPSGKGTTGILIVTRASSYIVQRFYSNSTFTYRSSYDGGSGWNNWI